MSVNTMYKIKAIGMISIKNLIREKGEAFEEAYLSKLTEKEKEHYLRILPVSYIPLDIAGALYKKAAKVLHEDMPVEDGLQKLSYYSAQNNVNGVYKILFKVINVETILKKAAQLWKTYYTAGEGFGKKLSNSHFQFIVKGFPELPRVNRIMIIGFIRGLVELSGNKHMDIVHKDENKDEWIWDIIIL